MPNDGSPTGCDPSDRDTDRRVGPGEAMLFFIFLVPVFLLGGTLLQSWRLVEGTLVTEWLLILLPLVLFIRIRGKSVSGSLGIGRADRRHLFGSAVLALSAIPLVAELAVLQDMIYPIPEEFLELMKEAFTIAGDRSAITAFMAFCVTPAVCEEALFRGLLLQAFRRRAGSWGAIVVTGVLFGLFHVNVYRFLPTAVIGFIIGYVVLSSASLIPGMLYHGINNAVALAVLNLPWLSRYPWLLEESHIPIPVLLVCSIGFAWGVIVLRPSSARRKESEIRRRSV
jgi:membrane protease YdiL (CAAX protease family)